MLSKQIKMLRINAEMSQLQLAENLNVSPSAVGMYEQGRRMPAIDTLIRMAKLFGVSLDYLIIGTEACSSITDDKAAAIQHACPCRVCCACYNKTESMHVININNEVNYKELKR